MIGLFSLHTLDMTTSSKKAIITFTLATFFLTLMDGMGVSGVIVIAVSHISIHARPERSFASIDVFMFGNCDPQTAISF